MDKDKNIYILGISGGFSSRSHAVAATLLKNSEIIAAIEEERLVRIKNVASILPKKGIAYCLSVAGITIRDIDFIAFHVNSYAQITVDIQEFMIFHFGYCPEIKLVEHHQAHTASAFFSSGFTESKIITFDYSGDGISTTLNYGQDSSIKRLKEYRKPNSLGIFYGIMTQFLGFNLDEDEYKVMGLAAYGKYDQVLKEKMDKILKIEEFGYIFNNTILKERPVLQQHQYSNELLNILGPNRKSDEPVTQREKDIAYAAQRQFEAACLAVLRDLSRLVPSRNLCLTGGSSLNCVMNSVLLQSEYVDNIFVPPAAGDNGTSLGSALAVANELGFKFSGLKTPFLGPEFTNEEIKKDLDILKLSYVYMEEAELLDYVASKIIDGKIVGWFQGRLEFGARALGNRSILANPQDPSMKDKLNKLIKFRETFRPFAPSVALEDADKYFFNLAPSPYMTLTFDVRVDNLPAITHVDKTARVQTVTKEDNELYYKLIKTIGEKTGVAIILNTSLNVMGQPIACTPKDALTVFGSTGMDIIVLGNYIISKHA